MSARGVRIVVGEGPSTRKGLLRFVLDGEGFDVVADAGTTAELARLMAIHRPDVVVLDDGIGATAVSMINEMSPNTKVVLVWPGAVMPVGGAARVEPSRVLQDLGPAIARLTGQPGDSARSRGAALLDRAANDPDMLRAMLLGGLSGVDEPIIEDREPAPVVILPFTQSIDHDELILNVPDAELDDDERSGIGAAAGVSGLAAGASVLAGSGQAAAAEGATGAATATPLAARRGALGAQSALNRRLGNLALSGAAVASALVLALALGGARVPVNVSGLGPSTTPQTPSQTDPPGSPGTTGPGETNTNPEQIDPGTADIATTFPSVTLVSDQRPEPPGPPEVVIDPGDLGPGGGDGGDPPGGGDPPDDGDDHSGGDSGDHDRGGGNDDPDNGGGGGDDDGDDDGGGDDDGDDHDSGGGNDDDGGDHNNGGGNDDEDNPANDGDGSDEPAGDNSNNGNNGNNEGEAETSGEHADADVAEDPGTGEANPPEGASGGD